MGLQVRDLLGSGDTAWLAAQPYEMNRSTEASLLRNCFCTMPDEVVEAA